MKAYPSVIFKLALCVGITANTARAADFLIDVDFGGDTPSGKTGLAAIGNSESDFWNVYLRNDGFGNWREFGALSNLKTAGGTTTPVGMTVANAPGGWGSGSTDPMYNDYIYPFGGDATVTLSSLPAGLYDLYIYSADGNYEVTVGSTSYGVKHTRDSPLSVPLVWTEGTQYARYSSIAMNGEDLVLTARPGLDGYALLAGLQIVAVPEPTTTALLGSGLVGAFLWFRTRRKGPIGNCRSQIADPRSS